MVSGVYKITNLINEKCYIGSGVIVKRRLAHHITRLKHGKNKNRHLQAAYNKYGKENFKFEIVEYCEAPDVLIREQHWIDITKCADENFGYNSATVAGNTIGYKHRKETLDRLSGDNHHRSFLGKKHDAVTIDKIMAGVRGIPKSPEHRAKLAEANRGKKASTETKRKQSEKRKGRVYGPETFEKRRISMLGKNRKASKWPCADGWKCKCDSCRNQRNQLNIFYRERKNGSDLSTSC